MLLTSLTLFLFTACGDKEEDTATTEDTNTEETETEDTETEDTDTEDTDTEDTETETTDAAEEFCELFVATCGDWPNETACVDFYNAAPAGTEGDNSGATQACYEFHLNRAIETEDTVHCEHASGESPCVD